MECGISHCCIKTIHSQLACPVHHCNTCITKFPSIWENISLIFFYKLKLLPWCFQTCKIKGGLCRQEVVFAIKTFTTDVLVWSAFEGLSDFFVYNCSSSTYLWVQLGGYGGLWMYYMSVALLGNICHYQRLSYCFSESFGLKRILHPIDEKCHLLSLTLGLWLTYGGWMKLFLV